MTPDSMPKRLVLLRHAKSAYPDDVPDHDRPLAARGRRDAPAVGRWLAERGDLPDMAFVSSAARAQETFALVNAQLAEPIPYTVTSDLYGAGAGDLLDLVRNLDDDLASALIVGHNPGIGMLASLLDQRQAGYLEFKTSAIAVMDVGRRWSDVDPGAAELVATAIPRG
jgi:phosphohistidine phosphatase